MESCFSSRHASSHSHFHSRHHRYIIDFGAYRSLPAPHTHRLSSERGSERESRQQKRPFFSLPPTIRASLPPAFLRVGVRRFRRRLNRRRRARPEAAAEGVSFLPYLDDDGAGGALPPGDPTWGRKKNLESAAAGAAAPTPKLEGF